MTGNVTEVSKASTNTAEGAEQVNKASQELSQMAETLKSLVGQFKV